MGFSCSRPILYYKMTSQGVTYNERDSVDVSTTNNYDNDHKTGKGIRVSEERWEDEYFTIPYEESHNKSLDKRFLETGQIVAVREDKKTKNCPYRVKREEFDTYIKITLTSCHGGAPDILFISRGEHGYKWKVERNGNTKPGHEISVMAVSDQFLVEQLEAKEEYVSGAI